MTTAADCLHLSVYDLPSAVERREGVLTFDALWRTESIQMRSTIAPASSTEWMLDFEGSPFGRPVEAYLYAHLKPRHDRATGRVLGHVKRFACPYIIHGHACDRDVARLFLYRNSDQFTGGCHHPPFTQRSESFWPQWDSAREECA